MSDLQFGNPAMNLDKHIEYTDYIINTPGLYVALLGDELDTFFPGFYSGRPVSNTIFPPQQQLMYFEKWLEDIQDKLLFATWDNHTDMRFEKAIGFSPAAMLKSKFCPYFNGIGQTFLTVGMTEYHIVSSHFFRGKSKYNPLHGVMSFAREQVQTADIYVQGDQHQASVGHFELGGKDRVYITTGTHNDGDEYTERFYTPFSQLEMPCVVLDDKRRKMTPFRTMEDGGIYIKGCE